MGDVPLERRRFFFAPRCQQGNFADFGQGSCSCHHPFRGALDEMGAGVDHGWTLCQERVYSSRICRLRDRKGFAREDRFIRFRVIRLEEAGVGGNAVAGREADDVTGDERVSRTVVLCPVTSDAGPGLHIVFEAFQDGLCFLFLPISQHRVDGDRGQDDAGVRPFA